VCLAEFNFKLLLNGAINFFKPELLALLKLSLFYIWNFFNLSFRLSPLLEILEFHSFRHCFQFLASLEVLVLVLKLSNFCLWVGRLFLELLNLDSLDDVFIYFLLKELEFSNLFSWFWLENIFWLLLLLLKSKLGSSILKLSV
jgi:hypothetical protein